MFIINNEFEIFILKKNIIYAYVKGARYENYKVIWEKYDVNKTFDTQEEPLDYVISNSNFDSTPVQFYY